jgi:predicted nucleotidyltransferase
MEAAASERLVEVLRQFGFDVSALSPELFRRPDQLVRLGEPPVRIELLTTIDGVSFDDCFPRGVQTTLGGVQVRMLGLDDLKTNKRAAGRHQDLADLEHLP